MVKITHIVLLLVAMVFFTTSCKSALNKKSNKLILADVKADVSSKYLMARIKKMAEQGYAFGHQDATSYGLGWKNDGSVYRSDVASVAGDFPGVYGFDLGHLELGHAQNLDSVSFKTMSKLIMKAHQQGGIITISWHPNNPLTNKSTWDKTPAVPHILKEGSLHVKYRAWLFRISEFLNGLKTKKGESIPIVFRPFHEMNGSWFWWGKGNCSAEDYKKLWRETFEILTNTYKVNNLMFCYATDAVSSKADYLKYYPGGKYVDMLGIDLYHKGTTEEYVDLLNTNLSVLSEIAKEKNMPFALTEGGLNMIPDETWWTEVLDKNIAHKGLAWALFWRNAWPNHYFVPYEGQKSSKNFIDFKKLPHVLFLEEVSKIK